jgi:hypothetical protein
MLTDLQIASQVIFEKTHSDIIKGEERRIANGRDGEGREEADQDNGYDTSGWASVSIGDSDEDRGYDSHSGGDGQGGILFGGGMGGSHV